MAAGIAMAIPDSPAFSALGRNHSWCSPTFLQLLGGAACGEVGRQGKLSQWGTIAGLPHISFKISLEMRALGFPAAVVLCETV